MLELDVGGGALCPALHLAKIAGTHPGQPCLLPLHLRRLVARPRRWQWRGGPAQPSFREDHVGQVSDHAHHQSVLAEIEDPRAKLVRPEHDYVAGFRVGRGRHRGPKALFKPDRGVAQPVTGVGPSKIGIVERALPICRFDIGEAG